MTKLIDADKLLEWLDEQINERDVSFGKGLYFNEGIEYGLMRAKAHILNEPPAAASHDARDDKHCPTCGVNAEHYQMVIDRLTEVLGYPRPRAVIEWLTSQPGFPKPTQRQITELAEAFVKAEASEKSDG